jgi:hypothetical protein
MRVVLPVYDVETDSVKALLVSGAMSPHSLGPQLRVEIDKGGLDERFLLISRRYAKYEVTSTPMTNGAESGEIAIADFMKRLQEGRTSLEGVIPRLSNSELAEIQEVQRKANALGLKQVDYAPHPKALAVTSHG